MNPIELGLPHREPFIFVERVTALEPGNSALGEKTFPAGEPFFRGHFPGEPIVPGVILTEALAQLAGLAVGKPGLRLAAIRGMKFPAAARPDDRIALEAKKLGEAGGLWQFAVTARVGETVVADGAVVLG